MVQSKPQPEELPPHSADGIAANSFVAKAVKAKRLNQSGRKKLRLAKDSVKGIAKPIPHHWDFIELPPGAMGQALAKVVPECAQQADAWGKGDVLDNALWNRLRACVKKRQVGWLHLTFAANPFRPAGAVESSCQEMEYESRRRAGRICSLLKIQARAGGRVSLAHPAKSIAWDLPSLTAAAASPALCTFVGDLCTEGGLHLRPTRWLTNCEWMGVARQRCPGAPVHPRHLPFGTFCGSPKHQDLPRDFCERIAEHYAVADKARLKAPGVQVTPRGILDPFSKQTARQRKEAENTNAIGGLRNPHVSIVKVPGWWATGGILECVLEEMFLKHRSKCEQAVGWLGSEEACGFGADIVEGTRHKLCEALGHPHARLPKEGLSAELVEALVRHAEDPDVSLPEWLRGGTPLGIEKEIKGHGIFPPALPEVTAPCAFEHYVCEELGNYTSYKDNEKLAEEELLRERKAGYMEFSSDRKALERKHGKLHPSRMGAIVKVRKGKLKTRIVHDLRRSGRNIRARVPERVVLPRLLDAVEGTLVVARSLKPSEDAKVGTLDFIDAFKQLWVAPEERKHLSGCATLEGVVGFFVYLTVLFGVKSGPLVWGRLAAFVMRATAALSRRAQATFQCFVDDPFFCLGGSENERGKALAKTLLLWEALGLKLSWRKGSWGDKAEWIGAEIQLVRDASGSITHVAVTIDQAKEEKIRLTINALLTRATIKRKELREFAGLTTWAASVVPPLRPFVQMIWAATASWPAKGETPFVINVARVRLPLKWMSEFCAEQMLKLPRAFPVHPAETKAVIGFDASTTGGGAWITFDQHVGAIRWWATAWTDDDEKVLKATRGKPEHQATWECYALVLAISTWSKDLEAAGCQLELRGDAQGVLQAVLARRGRSPIINSMVAETQLLLGRTMLDMYAVHVWSEDNEVADALSRLTEGAVRPDSCLKEKENKVKRRQWKFIGKQQIQESPEIEEPLQ